MKCLFCDKELDDPTHHWVQFEVMSEFYCDICNTQFTIHERTDKLVEYIIVSGYYRLRFKFNTINQPHLFVLGYNDHDSTVNIYNTVLVLDNLPVNVTPDNVKEKLKTLLTFS